MSLNHLFYFFNNSMRETMATTSHELLLTLFMLSQLNSSLNMLSGFPFGNVQKKKKEKKQTFCIWTAAYRISYSFPGISLHHLWVCMLSPAGSPISRGILSTYSSKWAMYRNMQWCLSALCNASRPCHEEYYNELLRSMEEGFYLDNRCKCLFGLLHLLSTVKS